MINDATRYPTQHPIAPADSSGLQDRPRLSLRLGFIFSLAISSGIGGEEFGAAAILYRVDVRTPNCDLCVLRLLEGWDTRKPNILHYRSELNAKPVRECNTTEMFRLTFCRRRMLCIKDSSHHCRYEATRQKVLPQQ